MILIAVILPIFLCQSSPKFVVRIHVFKWRVCFAIVFLFRHIDCAAGFRPKTSVAEKIAIICVLPLLLSGILGSPSSRQQLEEYLRKLLIQNTKDGSFSMHHTAEIIDAIRFLWFVLCLNMQQIS